MTHDLPLLPERLPTGTLTFLFTDVEGSTRLWEHFPEQTRATMARHDDLIEFSVAKNEGNIVRPRGEGDSRFAVFEQPVQAVAAACEIQQLLFVEPWPLPSRLRVRIGLHTGPADLREGDYYGAAVNRCARLRSAAHGGQTLLSQATYDLVKDALPRGVSVRNLGEHRLKDLQSPESIYQLVISDLPTDFPPIKALESLQTNLPAALTSFIGRDTELASVKRLMDTTRLLTITGMGGAGKTRLALQAATDLLDSFVDGVWLVDLARLSNPQFVSRHVADTLGIREEKERSIEQSLIVHLRPKEALIVLDNCEHLIKAVASLSEAILQGAPDLHILATSREALRIAGEKVWQIPPLSNPRLDGDFVLDKLSKYDAVKLFVDRALSVKPDFMLTEADGPWLVKICAYLDGMPLAIELAAARLRVLSVHEIAARLDDRFRLLVSSSRTAVPRQQSLRALIDWSYELLTPSERVLLRRLAVFVGGWTLESAEEVCSGGEIEAFELLDLLTSLIDKSLVIVEPQDDHDRYRFLETLRQYALERLVESNEGGEIERNHARYYSKLAQESYGLMWGPKQRFWLVHLGMEHENLRRALEWLAQEPDRSEQFLSMAGSLWRYWEIRGYINEGRAWMDRALAAGSQANPASKANALRGAGMLARNQGDYEQARKLHEQSLDLFRELDNKLGIGRELDALGDIAYHLGDYPQALALHTESLAIRYEIGDQEGMAMSLSQLGIIALDRGQNEYAGELIGEALELTRKLGDTLYTALSLLNLGTVAYNLNEYPRATELMEKALALYRELKDKQGTSNALYGLASVAKEQGYFKRAISLFEECLSLKEELGDKRGIARVIVGLAEVAFFQGNYAQAADFSEKSMALSRELGIKRGLITSLQVRAFVALFLGDDQLAQTLMAEGVVLSNEIDAPRGIAYSNALFGMIAHNNGRLEDARRLFGESLGLFQKIGDRRNVAFLSVNLARTAYRQGDLESGLRYLQESLSISHELDIRWCLAYSMEIMGLIFRGQDKYSEANQCFLDSLRISVEQENRQGILNCLGALAGLAARTEQPVRAARLFAVADRLREQIGVRMGLDDRKEYEMYLDVVRLGLDEPAFQVAWAEGITMSIEQAVAEAEEARIIPSPGQQSL